MFQTQTIWMNQILILWRFRSFLNIFYWCCCCPTFGRCWLVTCQPFHIPAIRATPKFFDEFQIFFQRSKKFVSTLDNTKREIALASVAPFLIELLCNLSVAKWRPKGEISLIRIKYFFEWAKPGHFLCIFLFFSNIILQTVGLSGIRTRIVKVDGE